MKILIDIGHPAHVHLFKNFALQMQKKGHDILFTYREKECEGRLLEYYGFGCVSFGKKYSSKSGKLWGLLKFDIQEFFTGLRFKPDIFLSHGSMYAAHISSILGKPHITLEDSGNWEQMKLYIPFSKAILTPDVLKEKLGEKQIRYNGYHELAYLHPNQFKPDKNILDNLNIEKSKTYAIIRFVNWRATHDIGHNGLNKKMKRELVKLLSSKMKVFISVESKLEPEFEQYNINFCAEKMHDALAFSSIFVGEGATMASEAAVLGVPSFYISSITRSYCEDQEKYGLLFNFRKFDGVLEKINEILSIPSVREYWGQRRIKMLKDKIDVTAFLVWFVESYPESFRIMKENPEYQYNFK